MQRIWYKGALLWHADDPENPYRELIDAFPVLPWSLDFCRKIYEFGKIRRFLFRLVVGKYAFREFVGIREAIIKAHYDPYFEYGCENCEYHKERVGW